MFIVFLTQLYYTMESNDDLSAFLIPETLDESETILFFTYTELAILMFSVITGIFTNHTISGVIFGAVFLILYKKLQPLNNGYKMSHLMYWYCPEWLFNVQNLVPSSVRIFV